MDQYLLFIVLGLGPGAMIAGVAMGLVTSYRGSGIINLSLGAVAMIAGYAFWVLRTGEFGITLGPVTACLVTLVVALVLGSLIELLVFRPLRTATPIAKVVASLGVLLILQAAMNLAWGPYPKQVPPLVTSDSLHVFGGPVPKVALIGAAVAVVIAAAVSALYRWTGFGVATRAAAENETSAMMAGLSPNSLALANTLLSCTIMAVLGVLAGQLTSIDPVSLPLLIIPALAAALFASFTSIWVACLVGLAIGSAENLLYYASTLSWFPTDNGVPLPGVQQLLTFVLVVLALFVRGASLPGRSELIEKGLPAVPVPKRLRGPTILATVAGVAALIVFPYDFRRALVTTLVAFVLILSLVVIAGYVGQISVVQLSLAGVAAFVMAKVYGGWHLGFPIAPLLGALSATVLGFLIGVSALRVRGVQLAVVTIAGAVAIQQFWFANSTWGASETGERVGQPHIFGIDLGNFASFKGIDGKIPSPMLGFLLLAVAIVLALFVANMRRTNLGQRMLAVRSNERAAASVGISVRNVKLTAFAISSFIAGIAGAMAAYNYGTVSPANYDVLTALGVIAFAYIGGITMVSGAFIGALISVEALVPHFFQRFLGISGTWALLIGGVMLILNLIFYPEGIAGALRSKRDRRNTTSGLSPERASAGNAASTQRRWRSPRASSTAP